MKPAPFDYLRATSIDEVCALLSSDPDARIIAGGQTLMPMLAMRLVRPTKVVDVMRIAELRGMEVGRDSVLIRAGVTQSTIERSPEIAEALPLLARAIPWVGHPPTRQRGTIGGSIANADPAAELALVAVTLGAEIVVVSAGGETPIRAERFFLSPMVTALPAGSLIVGVRFPRKADRQGMGIGFREVAARRGDFALAAAAGEVSLAEDGRVRSLRIAIGGATGIPALLDTATLTGEMPTEKAVRDCLTAGIGTLEMLEDPHASAAYRRRAAVALAISVVADACAEARLSWRLTR